MVPSKGQSSLSSSPATAPKSKIANNLAAKQIKSPSIYNALTTGAMVGIDIGAGLVM